MVYDQYYTTVFIGGAVIPGDWATFVRNDAWKYDKVVDRRHRRRASEGCTGAADIATNRAHNDFEYQIDENDDPANDDRGGLVRAADVNANGVDEYFAELQLLGEVDGRTDPDLNNGESTDLQGDVNDSSTYTLCVAHHPRGGKGYTYTTPPQEDAEFTHYPNVQVHVQHEPPSSPPPSPPPPACPLAPPPPPATPTPTPKPTPRRCECPAKCRGGGAGDRRRLLFASMPGCPQCCFIGYSTGRAGYK